jgi:hypothetical protein
MTENEGGPAVVYASDPIPRHAGPPTSATPLGDYLATVRNGVDPAYLVIPRSLAESMPLPWQEEMARLIFELQQAYGKLPWPVYRVVPSRVERLADLDEEQLAEVGCLAEIDTDGELRYRDREGRVIENPEEHEVLVSCVDPIPRATPAPQPTPTSSPVWPSE